MSNKTLITGHTRVSILPVNEEIPVCLLTIVSEHGVPGGVIALPQDVKAMRSLFEQIIEQIKKLENV